MLIHLVQLFTDESNF